MNSASLIQRMKRMPATLQAMISDVPESELKWRPADGGWSILEIICHLADEETDDFRPRIQITLQQDGTRWPSIDPRQAAIDRDYQSQAIESVIERFTGERQASLEWLQHLDKPDWNAEYDHPVFGIVRAGDLLAAWVAHDALHIRQIAKRLYQMTQQDAAGFSTAYAGDWVA